MAYTSIRNDYTLADAFHALGVHLYDSEWTGYEIWGEKAEDPKRTLKARAPFEAKLDEKTKLLLAKHSEQKEVVGKDKIFQINTEIRELKDQLAELSYRLHEIGEVRSGEIDDHKRWERFSFTEGLLLRTFQDGKLTVKGISGLVVKPSLWAEFPEGFGYDWELSLIFWPPKECAKRMDSGRINKLEFEDWLSLQVPLAGSHKEELSPFVKCRLWIQELKKASKVKPGRRDDIMRQAIAKFPGLTERAFKHAWSVDAYESWKKSGAPKKMK